MEKEKKYDFTFEIELIISGFFINSSLHRFRLFFLCTKNSIRLIFELNSLEMQIWLIAMLWCYVIDVMLCKDNRWERNIHISAF